MARDVPSYVDLTLFDVDAQSLVSTAVDTGRSRLPGWVPREGHTEVVLLELLAQITDEQVYAINRLPGVMLENALVSFGLVRDAGTAAVASARIHVGTDVGLSVPAGTALALELGGTTGSVIFTTDVELVIAAGATSATVPVTASAVGAGANGTPAGTALVLLSSGLYLERAELASAITSGTEPEDGPAFLARGTPRLGRLVDTLVHPEHFTAAAIETVGVARARTINLYNGEVPTAGAPGTVPGHVSVAVAGANGSALDEADAEDLRARLQAAAFVLLTVHVVPASVHRVDVDARVIARAGYSEAEVRTGAQVALESYLAPDAWEWGEAVYRNEVLALLDGVVGVERVVDVTLSSAEAAADSSGDLPLPGIAPLVRLGALTLSTGPAGGGGGAG